MLKILVIGQGGREHALIRALSVSGESVVLHALPGSDGISTLAICHAGSPNDFETIVNICLKNEIDYVMVGPEDPLVAGLADRLRERGILVVGPSQEAAQLEGSKIFAKKFMVDAKIPTAPFDVVTSVAQTLEAAKKYEPPYIFKADGLAAGKGVFICQTLKELEGAATDVFDKKILGAAGEKALLEANLPGWELSFLILTNGKQWEALPLAQDHKRLGDGDKGPNTGGMGTIAPLKIADDLRERIVKEVINPSVSMLSEKNMIYRGVLFIGLMITPQGPSVLEYNIRFGDPETQVILPLLEGNWARVLQKLSQGHLEKLKWKNLHSCCVVMAAPGYPQNAEKGVELKGDLKFETNSSYFLHAGTKRSSDYTWVTNGGRVLCSLGLGSNRGEAIAQAYRQSEKVHWNGLQMRKDIGGKGEITNPNAT